MSENPCNLGPHDVGKPLQSRPPGRRLIPNRPPALARSDVCFLAHPLRRGRPRVRPRPVASRLPGVLPSLRPPAAGRRAVLRRLPGGIYRRFDSGMSSMLRRGRAVRRDRRPLRALPGRGVPFRRRRPTRPIRRAAARGGAAHEEPHRRDAGRADGRAVGRPRGPGAPALGADVLVPVPLHWRRRWLRGYNQSEALAHGLAARLRLPCGSCGLRRIRATPMQTSQTLAGRRDNVRGAFAAAPNVRTAGKTVLLVDDVMTTGRHRLGSGPRPEGGRGPPRRRRCADSRVMGRREAGQTGKFDPCGRANTHGCAGRTFPARPARGEVPRPAI